MKEEAASTLQWTLVDQESLHDAQSSSDMNLENHSLEDSDETSSWSIAPNESAPSDASDHCGPINPRKRRASESFNSLEIGQNDVQVESVETENYDDMTPWCSTLAITLKKMPPSDQIEMKLIINNIIGKKELEIFKRKQHK